MNGVLYLEAFHDPRDGLMLQGRVLALGLLANDHHVEVLVPRLDPLQAAYLWAGSSLSYNIKLIA